ncbi:MAG: HIT domain-containing protein [Qingshengfaniella sp.]
MSYAYDPDNIFAKILAGEIPCARIAETEHALAFRDIHPQAPEHVLIIPKGPYVTYDHFAAEASADEIVDFTRLVAKVAAELAVAPPEGRGYRLLSNAGVDSHQEVPHMHVHLLAGRSLGPLVEPEVGVV